MKYQYEIEFETNSDNIIKILETITEEIRVNLVDEAIHIKPTITLL